MKKLQAVLSYAVVLLTVLPWSDSTCVFVAAGVGLVVLLDRYAFRLLPWTGPVR